MSLSRWLIATLLRGHFLSPTCARPCTCSQMSLPPLMRSACTCTPSRAPCCRRHLQAAAATHHSSSSRPCALKHTRQLARSARQAACGLCPGYAGVIGEQFCGRNRALCTWHASHTGPPLPGAPAVATGSPLCLCRGSADKNPTLYISLLAAKRFLARNSKDVPCPGPHRYPNALRAWHGCNRRTLNHPPMSTHIARVWAPWAAHASPFSGVAQSLESTSSCPHCPCAT